jgi:hypothetical protein
LNQLRKQDKMPNEVGSPIVLNKTQPEFGLLNNRRLIRSVKNPMDKSTIVSIFPKEILEIKHTIEPGHFVVPAGSIESPAVLTVGSSSWWKDIDIDQPMLEIPVSSIQVANSVINDYCTGMLGCNMADLMPGLFFVMGAVTVIDIKTKYKTELDKANEKQNNWYRLLVRLADSLWARSNGNPLVICDEMRLAARALNNNSKPWLQDFQAPMLVKCKFCGGLRNPDYPICPACKAIDQSHPLAKEIKFAV